MLSIGDKVPNFTGFDVENKEISLSNFIGKKVVIYFYPKDDTPGCTKEACSFRDNFTQITEKGIIVIGISTDDVISHQKFKKKYDLPFNLIADPDKKIVNMFEVFKEKNMYGKKILGTVRTTFLINEEGEIIHIFKKPKSEIHATEVLNKFNSM